MKYPRTYHFSFSQEIHSDDKRISKEAEENNFINKLLVITEKLDGGNACLKQGKVFARTHATEATHPSFSMLNQINAFLKDKIQNFELFGENMQGIHSIEYSKILSPFYIFNIRKDNLWFDWNTIEQISKNLKIPTAPVVFKGQFSSMKELQEFLENELKKESFLGGEREGFVIRPLDSFTDKEFPNVVAKFVRKGHVQTDDHWSKNWKEAKIDTSFWSQLYGDK